MKIAVQIIILFISVGAFACDCDEPGITEKYQRSDFIADVTILKIYPNKETERGYRADVRINKLYKGKKLSSIYVYGRSDGGIGTSCDIFIPAGEKLIVYTGKNEEGNFGTGMCSGNLYLNSSNKQRQQREQEILETLKKNEINHTSSIPFRETGNLNSELKKFNGLELEKSFAIYELTFAPDLTIKEVKEISGFNNAIDDELLQIIRNSEWSSFYDGKKNEVPDNTIFLLGIFYYPAEGNDNSFLSHYYL